MRPPSNESRSSSGEAAGAQPQDLRLEKGESVILSPESPRFASGYRQVRPRSIDEVRKLMGPTKLSGHAASADGFVRRAPELADRVLVIEDLESKDPVARAEAHRLAYLAAQAYVHEPSTAGLKQWQPAIDRWLGRVKPVINIYTAGDIEIADGATLVLSANTQGLNARHIRMHGTGRIRCRGNVKISATSVDGS
ncbi:hypothetical protein AB0F25_25505 [Streptomyces wedmorensis]|uniref:hypothetical protein n=1 Tax=Streptomyces wedmorensis TaxID=43759 RepID=UPI00341EC2D6